MLQEFNLPEAAKENCGCVDQAIVGVLVEIELGFRSKKQFYKEEFVLSSTYDSHVRAIIGVGG